jgi:hypothetical protein
VNVTESLPLNDPLRLKSNGKPNPRFYMAKTEATTMVKTIWQSILMSIVAHGHASHIRQAY